MVIQVCGTVHPSYDHINCLTQIYKSGQTLQALGGVENSGKNSGSRWCGTHWQLIKPVLLPISNRNLMAIIGEVLHCVPTVTKWQQLKSKRLRFYFSTSCWEILDAVTH